MAKKKSTPPQKEFIAFWDDTLIGIAPENEILGYIKEYIDDNQLEEDEAMYIRVFELGPKKDIFIAKQFEVFF